MELISKVLYFFEFIQTIVSCKVCTDILGGDRKGSEVRNWILALKFQIWFWGARSGFRTLIWEHTRSSWVKPSEIKSSYVFIISLNFQDMNQISVLKPNQICCIGSFIWNRPERRFFGSNSEEIPCFNNSWNPLAMHCPWTESSIHDSPLSHDLNFF